jgi:AcrR family transcriptional regulator
MRANENVPAGGKGITRDKAAKIDAIIKATLALLETTGYEKVTIRDIAAAADVSVGLIYKYFPGGKADIVRDIFSIYIGRLWQIEQPENVDFDDFPGYMKAVIENMIQFWSDNRPLIKAVIVALLLEGEMAGELQRIEAGDYGDMAAFYGRFRGLDLHEKNAMGLVTNWSITIHGILLNNMLYHKQLMNDEALKNLLVGLSLKIWGYTPVMGEAPQR